MIETIDETNGRFREFFFTLNGIGHTISIPVFFDVTDYFSNKKPACSCDIPQYYLEYLQSQTQRQYLNELVEKIQETAKNQNDLARISISLVQRIPYDNDKVKYFLKNNPYARIRYPYEVISENLGICCEKSLLLAFLLKELGFGVGLFIFQEENHMALGIKSPEEFCCFQTEYAFVETTAPSIVTDCRLYYFESNKLGIFWNRLKSFPTIVPLCEGNSFNGVYEEFWDAKEWNELNEKYRNEDGYYFTRRLDLMRKYGF
jgi:hypothetical protein